MSTYHSLFGLPHSSWHSLLLLSAATCVPAVSSTVMKWFRTGSAPDCSAAGTFWQFVADLLLTDANGSWWQPEQQCHCKMWIDQIFRRGRRWRCRTARLQRWAGPPKRLESCRRGADTSHMPTCRGTVGPSEAKTKWHQEFPEPVV